jgi:NAD(P)-dependent dehydrogenase (short-subunit alcohol dehydrogenase family)
VTDRDACRALVAQTVEHYGGLDVLVNNAGLSMLARFDELDDLSLFDTLMGVNYFGAVYCTQAALPHLKQSGGLIVAISTLAGVTGVPLRTGYSASKHALQGFMDSLRIELMGSGVDVSIISPGFVDTQIREHSLSGDGNPLGYNPLKGRKMMSPEEAAVIIAQAIAGRKREVRMGTRGKLLPLGKVLIPGWVDRIAKRSADHR